MSEIKSMTIPLSAIDVPRRRAREVELDDGVRELAASIRQVGLLNPVQVRDLGGGRYRLLAGKRRYLAHTVLGATEIRATVQPHLDDETQRDLLDRLIELKENLDRQELTPLEIAEHLAEQERLLEDLQMRAKVGQAAQLHGLKTTADLAREHGVSERTYRDRVAVGQLPVKVRRAAREVPSVVSKWGELRELARADSEESALAALEMVATGDASNVAEARARVEAPAVASREPHNAQAERRPPEIIVWDQMTDDRWRASFRLAVEQLGPEDVLVTPAPVGDQLIDVARMLRGVEARHRAWAVVGLEPYAIWSRASALWPDEAMDFAELRTLLEEALR